MMTSLSSDVLKALTGRTLATAESCTGGGIGAALTAIPGSSQVYVGGVISYSNRIKETVLGVDAGILERYGPVSSQVAQAMAEGVRKGLNTDVAVSVTGLAGPGGDDYGNPVGTVFIGYCDEEKSFARHYCFSGGREEVRNQAICAVLNLILQENA